MRNSDFEKASTYNYYYKIALELTNFETTDYSLYIDTLIQVLEIHPHFHRILARLIEICAEARKLDKVEKRILNDKSPGMIFCEALYCMYCGNWNKALSLFRVVQNEHKWGVNAKIEIFRILINPTLNFIWFTNEPLSNEMQLHEDNEIIEELSVVFKDEPFFVIEKKLMQAEIHLSNNTANSMTKAESIFFSIIEQSKLRQETQVESNILEIQLIASLLGYAKSMLKKGNIKQANIFIDKVLQFKPSHETNLFFEETYLMRAKIFQNEKNFDAAHHFAFFALSNNMSSCRAWEMCAQISRPNSMYAEAVNALMYCWKLSGETDLDSAYDYAFCSMKADRPDDAIEMCRMMQNTNFNYKDLKNTILIPSYKKFKP